MTLLDSVDIKNYKYNLFYDWDRDAIPESAPSLLLLRDPIAMTAPFSGKDAEDYTRRWFPSGEIAYVTQSDGTRIRYVRAGHGRAFGKDWRTGQDGAAPGQRRKT